MTQNFQAAISALYAPSEDAFTLVANSPDDNGEWIVDLRSIPDPRVLPPFWTLATPTWYDPELGNIDLEGKNQRPRKLEQEMLVPGTGEIKEQPAYSDCSPFLCFEVDYLLAEKDKEPTDGLKKIQTDAMELAFTRTNFPYAVLVHSGSKSVHAFVRLLDPPEEIRKFRNGDGLRRLVDLAFMVFGHFDHGVLKQFGKQRLCRLPGAFRDAEKKIEQRLLSVGTQTTIANLFAWFYSQLSPAAIQHFQARQPIEAPGSPLRRHALNVKKWRDDLLVPRAEGERGTAWHWLSKHLGTAGCSKPSRFQTKPNAAMPFGEITAPWLWWVTAYTYNVMTNGWFFSQEPWKDNDRERWESDSTIEHLIDKDMTYRRPVDNTTMAVVDEWMKQQAEIPNGQFPPVASAPGANPPQFEQPGSVPPPTPPPKDKKEKKDDLIAALVEKFFTIVPRAHLIAMSKRLGGAWYHFNGTHWIETSEDTVKKVVTENVAFIKSSKIVNEVVFFIHKDRLLDHEWRVDPNAIAFTNGTLYISADRSVNFQPGVFKPTDFLRSVTPYPFDMDAECPEWERNMLRFLPDHEQRDAFQDMCGYTFLSGQPFQSFFFLLGTGSNFKSTAFNVLRAAHGMVNSESLKLNKIGDRFALGLLADKRIAFDGDCDSVGGRRDPSIEETVGTIKKWSGGDALTVERKYSDPHTAHMNAKLVFIGNRLPKFVDASQGLWRRFRIINFTVTIPDHEAVADYDKKLITSEMPGIIQWMIEGLCRVVQRGKLTRPSAMDKMLEDHRRDVDSVRRFMTEHMHAEPGTGWYCLQTLYRMYVEHCRECENHPSAMDEFKNRLGLCGVTVDQPTLAEVVDGVPAGAYNPVKRHRPAVLGYRITASIPRDLATGITRYIPMTNGHNGLNGHTNGHNGTNGHTAVSYPSPYPVAPPVGH